MKRELTTEEQESHTLRVYPPDSPLNVLKLITWACTKACPTVKRVEGNTGENRRKSNTGENSRRATTAGSTTAGGQQQPEGREAPLRYKPLLRTP